MNSGRVPPGADGENERRSRLGALTDDGVAHRRVFRGLDRVVSSSPTILSPLSLSSFRASRAGSVPNGDDRRARLDPRLELLATLGTQLLPLVVVITPREDEAVVIGQVDPAQAGQIHRHHPHPYLPLQIEPDGAERGLIDAVPRSQQNSGAIHRLDAFAADAGVTAIGERRADRGDRHAELAGERADPLVQR